MKTALLALCCAPVILGLAVVPAAGQGWTQQATGTTLVLYEVRMTNPESATAVGESGTILQTTNGGVTWDPRSSGTTTSLHSVEYADELIGVVVGDNGVMRRTTDAGQTWSALPQVTTDNLRGISFTDGTTGMVVGTNGTILRSTNAGATWTPVRGVAATLYEADFVTPDIGWVVGAGGTILKTTDGGTSWIQQTSGTGQTLFGVSFADSNYGTAVGTSGTIRRTTNGGASWAPQTSGVTGTLTSVVRISPAAGCIVGNGGVILRTSSGGSTWTPQNSGTLADLKEVSFVNENIGMVAGAGGTILKTTTGGVSPAALSLSSPNGGESYAVDGTMTITWTANGFTSVHIELSRDAGGSWETIAASAPAAGTTYAWTVTGPTSTLCKVRISDAVNPSLNDVTDGVFSITPATVTRTYSVITGWNLVSVPLDVADYSTGAVFPGAATEAFRFDTAAGYVPVTTLSNGVGYWLKFNAPASIPITGVPRDRDTIDVGQGWNLVGAVSASVATASVTTLPGGIIEGVFYGFNGAYFEAATLEPGQAYWVKCTQLGQLILDSAR